MIDFEWIIIYRKKTDTRSPIPVMPQAQTIIDKYKDDIEADAKGKLLPVNSNQRMNGYRKEIADITGITKNLTMHLARHTFATTVTLANGVPIETVSKMLGHTSIKTTQIYSKVVDILKTQVERYGLANDINQLQEISTQGREIIDYAGKFTRSEQGDIVFTFGKNKGKKVIDDPEYVDWMCGKDFTFDIKEKARRILSGDLM